MTLKINRNVFFYSSAFIFSVVGFAIFFTDRFSHIVDPLQDWIVQHFGWFYSLSVGAFFLFVLYLMFSPMGKIKLGADKEGPVYSFSSWIAMLFSAGMGIGLVFWSVAEPIFHFERLKEGGSLMGAASGAMQTTFVHWGIHAWGVYCLTGLAIAYAAFRKGLPLSIRSIFYPLLGKRIFGWMGDVTEIPAVVGTLFGVATSLGLGVAQVNAGLSHLLGIEQSSEVQIALVVIITFAATLSVVSGLDKGILLLSNLNFYLAAFVLLFVFLLGPSITILKSFVENVGTYIQHLPETSFRTGVYDESNWMKNWTFVYWPWWIAWSPFVGMFVARISRGRTIREFVAGVTIVPTLITFLWLTCFGESALRLEMATGVLEPVVSSNVSLSLYTFLEAFPLSSMMSVLATILVIIFFVTSSDSGSFVIDMIASGGNPNPPVLQKVYWASLEGLVAIALIWGGGLEALQTASIVVGLPFCILLWFAMGSLYKSLKTDSKYEKTRAETVQEYRSKVLKI